jgi:hypothetical protein
MGLRREGLKWTRAEKGEWVRDALTHVGISPDYK